MVSTEELDERRALAGEGDLAAVLATLVARARPVIERMPPVPQVKAMLSTEGGICERCGGQLEFDPWSPDSHRCPACGHGSGGPRRHAHWARGQHLWLAERAAHLAVVAAFTDDEAAAARSREILAEYYELYHALPNRDNVLGPSHLFFSTYLESIWILNYLAAAYLLRERGRLDETDIEAINAIADEAARLIGEFDEGMSNRQTWNSAALVAIAVWFEDDELAQSAIGGRTGLLGHLTDGFGDDGMWIEGENYHLFAIRGLLLGLEWARLVGADLLVDPRLAATLGRALMAPAATALPDLTFPARKDSRFGVSLAHPAYLESWEVGLARLGEDAPEGLTAWIRALEQVPASTAQTYDAYLHDAGNEVRTATTRADLSWWALLSMLPALPEAEEPDPAGSRLLETQGVAVLRQHGRYVALECGAYGGGHGHPDRLHLTVHDGSVHWLADPGTGSYVTADLFWYRSTLAHNAPRLDGRSQPAVAAQCRAFDDRGDWGWIVAGFEDLERTVVQGPGWLLDVVQLDAGSPRRLELPWHLDGDVTVETPGTWSPAESGDPAVSSLEVFAPAAATDVILAATRDGRTVRLHLVGGTVLRAVGPGRPGREPRPFHLVRAEGAKVRLLAVLELGQRVDSVIAAPDQIDIGDQGGRTTIRLARAAGTVSTGGRQIALGGQVPVRPPVKKLIAERPIRAEGRAFRIGQPPVLDGSFDGFDVGGPLELGDESHYQRSEDPYDSPETFSALAVVNWDAETLYLGLDIIKPETVIRPADAEPLGFDNDADDIHADGIQVYYRAGGIDRAFLIRPDGNGGLIARAIGGDPEPVALVGASAVHDGGYLVTVALPCPELATLEEGARLDFDLCVNEMRSDRVRRAGQLAWGGGGGWVYLRGDARDPSQWGVLDLIG